ncbi:50S ribosomal protein L37ae [Halorutilales archaeon Cl-col2-1]
MSEDETKGNVTRSAGRFGARYGRVARKRVADIEDEMNKDHDCPDCGAEKVSRTDTGIWECGKCGYRFTGGSYQVETPAGRRAELSIEEAVEEQN